MAKQKTKNIHNLKLSMKQSLTQNTSTDIDCHLLCELRV